MINYLQECVETNRLFSDIPGLCEQVILVVHSSTRYYGKAFTSFGVHLEDGNSRSINYLH